MKITITKDMGRDEIFSKAEKNGWIFTYENTEMYFNDDESEAHLIALI